MKTVIRITSEIMFWLWGLYILAYVAPGPVLWHYVAMYSVGIAVFILLGKDRRREMPTDGLMGLLALAHTIAWAYTWGMGWPDQWRLGVMISSMILSPTLITLRAIAREEEKWTFGA